MVIPLTKSQHCSRWGPSTITESGGDLGVGRWYSGARKSINGVSEEYDADSAFGQEYLGKHELRKTRLGGWVVCEDRECGGV